MLCGRTGWNAGLSCQHPHVFHSQVLATGELKGPITIRAAAFSEAAKAKIEAAGRKGTVVPLAVAINISACQWQLQQSAQPSPSAPHTALAP